MVTVAILDVLQLLIESEYVGQLIILQQQFPDSAALIRELVRRGWLTPFQGNQFAADKGNQLILDQYVLLDLLGEGGMGAVYKARQQSVKRIVAVKVIRPVA